MSTVHQNGTNSVEEMKKAAQAPRVGELRTVSWSESLDEGDLEVPGTPKGPRTSTTPGTELSVTLKFF
jgi:GTP cyclohydrolase IA